MRVPTLLKVARHNLPERAVGLAQAAHRQLGLAEAAWGVHHAHMEAGGLTSCTTAAAGYYDERSNGAYAAGILDASPDATARPDEIATALLRPGEIADMAARAFVYELALFRKMMGGLASLAPDPEEGGRLTTAFDISVPGLLPVRDSLAHLDERIIGSARGKAFTATPEQVEGFSLALGVTVGRTRIGVHTADGSFQEVALDAPTLERGYGLLHDVMSLFPQAPSPAA